MKNIFPYSFIILLLIILTDILSGAQLPPLTSKTVTVNSGINQPASKTTTSPVKLTKDFLLYAKSLSIEIVDIDVSWFPKVEARIEFVKNINTPENNFSYSNDNSSQNYLVRLFLKKHLSIYDGDKKINGFIITSPTGNNNIFEIKWLSKTFSDGIQQVKITTGNNESSSSYPSFSKHRQGEKVEQTFKLFTTGIKNEHFPCQILILHENGQIFEDISTQGGYSKLGTGFSIPSGDVNVELRLLSPDVSIDKFVAKVKPYENTIIRRKFGSLKLPNNRLSDEEKQQIHIEIEGLKLRYPAIRSNLYVLYNKLSLLPDHMLPLKEGKYKIYLLPATKESKQIRKEYSIEIRTGQVSEITL